MLCLLPSFIAANPKGFSDGGLSFPLDDKSYDPNNLDTSDRAQVRVLPGVVDPPPLDSKELEAFADYLENLRSDLGVPGAAIAIMQGDQVVLERCMGLRKVTEPGRVDTETLFNIGPATIAFSSLLAATLDNDASFSYEKLARRIWPRFRMNRATSTDTVTIANLFTMTAGVPGYVDGILDPAWARPEDVFEAIAQAPVIAPPGQLYEQSKISAAAAGYLTGLAAVRGKPLYEAFARAVDAQLFGPLGMDSATFSREAAIKSGNFATPHVREGAGFDPVKRWEPMVNAMAPAVGLKASLRDMQAWLATEMQLGVTPNGQRIAQELSIRQRWQPAVVGRGNNFGMGWTRRYYRGVEIIASMGSYDRQSAAIGILPAHRTGFIVLTNSGGEESNRLMQEVALGLAEIFTTVKASPRQPQLGIAQ